MSEDDKKEARRKLLAQEVASTELSYVSQLLMVKQLFLGPVVRSLESATPSQPPLLSEQEKKVLFGNLEDVLKHANEICKMLQLCVRNWSAESCISDTFKRCFTSEMQRAYLRYVSQYNRSLVFMESLVRTAKSRHGAHPFVKFQKEQEENPACMGLSLGGLLVTPVQRIPRYVLLFRDMVKYTPEHHPNRANLLSVYEDIQKVAAKINRHKGKVEDWEGLQRVQKLFGDEEQKRLQLLKEGRRLLCELDMQTTIESFGKAMLCKVMVFNDLLLVSKPAPTGLLGASGPVVITGAAEDPKYHVKLACHMMTPQIISSDTAGEGDEAQTTFELSCCTPTKLPPYMVETRVKLSASPSVAKEFEKQFEAGKRHMVDNLVAITDEYCSSVQVFFVHHALSISEWDHLATQVGAEREVKFMPKQYLISEGDVVDGLYYIEEGSVTLEVNGMAVVDVYPGSLFCHQLFFLPKEQRKAHYSVLGTGSHVIKLVKMPFDALETYICPTPSTRSEDVLVAVKFCAFLCLSFSLYSAQGYLRKAIHRSKNPLSKPQPAAVLASGFERPRRCLKAVPDVVTNSSPGTSRNEKKKSSLSLSLPPDVHQQMAQANDQTLSPRSRGKISKMFKRFGSGSVGSAEVSQTLGEMRNPPTDDFVPGMISPHLNVIDSSPTPSPKLSRKSSATKAKPKLSPSVQRTPKSRRLSNVMKGVSPLIDTGDADVSALLDKLGVTDVALHSVVCMRDDGKRPTGRLIVCKDHTCFYTKSSRSSRFVLKNSDLKDAMFDLECTISLHCAGHCDPFNIRFDTTEDASNALLLLQSFLMKRKKDSDSPESGSNSRKIDIRTNEKRSKREWESFRNETFLVKRCKRKDVVVPFGEVTSVLFQLLKGTCQIVTKVGATVSTTNLAATPMNAATVKLVAGDVFNAPNFFLGHRSSFEVVVTSETCHLAYLPREKMVELCNRGVRQQDRQITEQLLTFFHFIANVMCKELARDRERLCESILEETTEVVYEYVNEDGEVVEGEGNDDEYEIEEDEDEDEDEDEEEVVYVVLNEAGEEIEVPESQLHLYE